MSNFFANSVSLKELEEEFQRRQDLYSQKEAMDRQTTLIYGSYGSSMLIIICILMYLCCKVISSRASCFTNTTRSKQKKPKVTADCQFKLRQNYAVTSEAQVNSSTLPRCPTINKINDSTENSAGTLNDYNPINMGSCDTPQPSTASLYPRINEINDSTENSAGTLKEHHPINMGSCDTPLPSTSQQEELQFNSAPTIFRKTHSLPAATTRPAVMLPIQQLQPY